RAAELAPSSPYASVTWADALLDRGDIEAALKAAREAQRRAPRWAEPLKLEGDALLARRDHAGASRAYARAAKHAPTWGGLHLAWARALRGEGKTDEAAAMERRARTMSLSRAEKTALGIPG
ncbi:MAG TPA: hypothetical protein VEA15_10585, partial [Caulobacteraceae bacterium]|nr:hypothetical protein [Caulobacteraceae bacterium]